AREPERALLATLLTRVGNPLNWSSTDKVLFAALGLLPFVAWYAVAYYVALRRPEIAPYLDQAVLPLAFRIQLAFVGGWLSILVGALVLRRRAPPSRLLVDLHCQLYSITVLLGSYAFGHYTSLFTGVAVVGGYAAAFVLFERWATLPALASFLILL